jgi:hypothetical protein
MGKGVDITQSALTLLDHREIVRKNILLAIQRISGIMLDIVLFIQMVKYVSI